MKLQTSITFEALAKDLGLDPGLKIDHLEVCSISGILRIVVEGNIPPRTVTSAGFYPSAKRAGIEPDTVHISYLKRKDPS